MTKVLPPTDVKPKANPWTIRMMISMVMVVAKG